MESSSWEEPRKSSCPFRRSASTSLSQIRTTARIDLDTKRAIPEQPKLHESPIPRRHTSKKIHTEIMTITSRVQSQFRDAATEEERLIRIAPNQGRTRSPVAAPPGSGPSWTNEEHDRFLEAMELFPSGPWKVIANYVGTKTPRQTMTHAQKYRQKIARRQRGLKTTTTAKQQNADEYSQASAQPSAVDPALAAMVLMASSGSEAPLGAVTSYVPILPWSNFTTPQVVMQEHWDYVHGAPPNSPLFEDDADLAAFLLEDYEPLLFSNDFDASLEDEQEISRILAECGW